MAKQVAIMLDLDWPYRRHVDVFAGIQKYAEEAGDWNCILDEHADAAIGAVKRSPYDGVVARATERLAQVAGRKKVPLVNVWFNSPTRNLAGVFPDFVAEGRMAAEHLLQRGFRRFACLTSRDDRSHALITDSFHRVLAAQGCDCQCAQVVGPRSKQGLKDWSAFQAAINKWIAGWQPPVGVFVTLNNVGVRHVVHRAKSAGLRVPEDAAIITSMNEPLLCNYPPPSLTSLDVPYLQIGYSAAQLLDQLMVGLKPAHKTLMIPPLGIIPRQSTDFFAIDDDTVARAMTFIIQNVHRPLDVGDVVEAACASRRTLERRFQQKVGRSVAQEIRRMRVERAKRELLEPELSIKQVASRCGFASSIRLHEMFVREVGLSPTEFRSQALHRRTES